jgi:hypothetical protein
MVEEIMSELFSTAEFPAITKFGSKLVLAGYAPEGVNECIGDNALTNPRQEIAGPKPVKQRW